MRIQYQEPPQSGRYTATTTTGAPPMNIVKPSVDGALSFIAKGIKQLDAAIAYHGNVAQKARDTIAKADADMQAAQAEIERGNRAKKKLEELVA